MELDLGIGSPEKDLHLAPLPPGGSFANLYRCPSSSLTNANIWLPVTMIAVPTRRTIRSRPTEEPCLCRSSSAVRCDSSESARICKHDIGKVSLSDKAIYFSQRRSSGTLLNKKTGAGDIPQHGLLSLHSYAGCARFPPNILHPAKRFLSQPATRPKSTIQNQRVPVYQFGTYVKTVGYWNPLKSPHCIIQLHSRFGKAVPPW